ncbi:MAG: amino acid racemase [Oscillospiraceae bacterium]|nr:amino acid racemase [Oscillospiraceae bacterium]
MKKAIGILGGMGPLATCDLMEKIIRYTYAKKDQDHVHILVDCNTNIPDRTAAILGDGESPLPEMVKSAQRLQQMGAEALIMPCNTAHYFLPRLRQCVDIPFLSILEETASYLKAQGVQTAAVLATDGTVKMGLYETALQEAGITTLYPQPQEQALLMALIYDYVKAGKPCPHPEEIVSLCDRLVKQGAQSLILGCTELPVAFAEFGRELPTVDPTELLAKAAIRFAGCKIL